MINPSTSDMTRISHVLTDGKSADACHALLRWLGFQGWIDGLYPLVKFLNAQLPTIKTLGISYPKLASVWLNLEKTGNWLDRLAVLHASCDHALDPGLTEADLAVLHNQADKDSTGLSIIDQVTILRTRLPGNQGFDKLESLTPEPLAASIFIAAFGLRATLDGQSNLADFEFRSIHIALRVFASPQFLLHPSPFDGFWTNRESVELPELLESIASRITNADLDATQLSMPREAFTQFKKELETAHCEDYPVPDPQDDTKDTELSGDEPAGEEDDDPKRWGNSPSTELSDRALAIEWNHALSTTDYAIVQSAVAMNLYQETIPLRKSTVLTRAGALIATNIALKTGKTVAMAMNIRVLRCQSRAILGTLTTLPGDLLLIVPMESSNQLETYWRTPSAQTTNIHLRLEFAVPPWPHAGRDFLVHELLALPIERTIPDIGKELVSRLHRSIPKINIAFRHALAREMFAFNGHRGIIQFLCNIPIDQSEATSSAAKRESLSDYLHPDSTCIRDAYRYAQGRITSVWASPAEFNRTPISDELACRFVPAGEMQKLTAALRQSLDQPPNDILDYHCRYIAYVSTMLVSGLGMRRSNELLPFSFDISLIDLVAFIADKIQPGSEARFVPLAETIAAQLTDLIDHDRRLLAFLAIHYPTLASEIIEGRNAATAPDISKTVPNYGQLITFVGTSASTVKTATVDNALASAARLVMPDSPTEISTRSLRRNVATYLSEFAPTGMLVEIQLGHNSGNHVFGPGSSWVPNEEYARLRPLIERYLLTNGWKVVKSTLPEVGEIVNANKPLVPGYSSGAFGYEGRQLSAEAALDRAYAAIADCIDDLEVTKEPNVWLDEDQLGLLSAEIAQHTRNADLCASVIAGLRSISSEMSRHTFVSFDPRSLLKIADKLGTTHSTKVNATHGSPLQQSLSLRKVISNWLAENGAPYDDTIEIDTDTLAALQSRIDECLAGDHEAQAKVRTALASRAAKWRRTNKFRITAPALNLARYKAGPLTIQFGRHLAIANHVAAHLHEGLNTYLSRNVLRHEHRLAVIMVLLIVQDAVINSAELAPLLSAVQHKSITNYDDELQIRATIEGRRCFYDRTIDLSPLTMAAIAGYLRQVSNDSEIDFPSICIEANALIRRIAGHDTDLDWMRLVEVMRPYWFLRFPGSTYASVIGQQSCNAPSLPSMALLLGKPPPPLTMGTSPSKAQLALTKAPVDHATALIRKLLGTVDRLVEEHKASSRAQRKALRSQFEKGLPDGLLELMIAHPIVDLWVEFIRYMLEEGGVREDILKFSTLRTYQRRILDYILELAWEADLREFSSNDFDVLYRSILKKIDEAEKDPDKTDTHADALTVLRLFHCFLQSWHRVPPCQLSLSSKPFKSEARSVVLPFDIIQSAVKTIESSRQTTVDRMAAVDLLLLNTGYMLRPMEGYGIRAYEFESADSFTLRVSINSTRELKTRSRVIPFCIANHTMRERILGRRYSLYDPRRKTEAALFADPGDRSKLLPLRVMTGQCYKGVKLASGDPLAILYSVRHTSATALISHLLTITNSVTRHANAIAKALAIPEDVAVQIATLRCGKLIYPFQIDRVGYWLGHSGCGTASTVYWHGAWWIASAYVARNSPSKEVSDRLVSLLLHDLTPKAITIRKRRYTVKHGRSPSLAELIQRYVRSVCPSTAVQPPLGSLSTMSAPFTPFLLSISDTLMMLRRTSNGPFDSAVDAIAATYVAPQLIVRQYFACYHKIAEQIGFLDFEPDSTRSGAALAYSVERGQATRQRLLLKIQEICESSPEFAIKTKEIVQWWRAECNPLYPMWVVHSTEQLAEVSTWLEKLGYTTTDISVSTRAVDATTIECLTAKGYCLHDATQPIARSHRLTINSEYGITVNRMRSLPAGRELHRVMFAMACCMDAKLFLEDTSTLT